MSRVPPIVWCVFSFDSSGVLAKFCHHGHDRLLTDDGWLLGGYADDLMNNAVALGFEHFHQHNPGGRESTTSEGMVLDQFLLRRQDAPYMIKDFIPAWRPWALQYEIRAYFGSQWANSRVSKHLGIDRGFWSAAGVTFNAYDRVFHNGKTWQTLVTSHVSDALNFPGSAVQAEGMVIWFEIHPGQKSFGNRADRYFRIQDESIWPVLAAGMDVMYDLGGVTRENDPSMAHIRRLIAAGRMAGIEASPLTGYDWLYDLDCAITSQNLPVVIATADQPNGYADLSNITKDICIIITSEPGYQRTHTGAWSNVFGEYSYVEAGLKHAVSHGGSHYFCKLTHVAAADKEPGTGGGAAFWDVVPDYLYFIPNATFANVGDWLKQLFTMYMDDGLSVGIDPSAMPPGSNLEDFLPDGYPGAYTP